MPKKFLGVCIVLAMVLSLLSVPASAQSKPIQISLFTPVQIFNENTPIGGLRINLIYGRNVSVTGFDWGLVNHTTTGISTGIQWGAVNLNDNHFTGWQDGVVNYTKGNAEGLQTGFVNYANYASGVQFGVVNYARSMKGLQIGLVNIIKQGGAFPVFPIVNWSF